MMKGLKWILLTGICVLMSSCSWIPQEEVLPAAPIIQEYKREEVNQVQAVREDMLLQETLSCVYVPMQSETLAYAINGEYYGDVFVKAGDWVEKGQLLAQLDIEDALKRLEQYELSCRQLELRLTALEENRALLIERERILSRGRSAEQTAKAIAQVNETCDRQKQVLVDEMQVLQIKQKEQRNAVTQRQLFAGISGTVTYVRHTSAGAKCTAGEKMIVISDATTSLFRAQTKYAHLIETGSEYVISVKGQEYEAVAAEPSTEQSYVYFELKNPVFDMQEGDKGALTLNVDFRKDVITLPQRAVSKINSQDVVYYLDEEGMTTYKVVEIGLKANGRVEILSGVAEGEYIVVR